MLLVRDLTKLAWFRSADAFVRFLGPIVLMQQPPSEEPRKGHFDSAVPPTVPLPQLNPDLLLAPLGGLGGLAVTMLPETTPEGTVQLVIGRDPACALVIDHPAVSANHAAIRWDGTQAIVVDLASANGTFINKKKIRQATLTSGDQLSFGLSTFVYLLSVDLHAKLRRFKPD